MKKTLSVRGFTLIELLLALSLFSVVSVALGSVFRSGIETWEKLEKGAGGGQETRIFLQTLGRELRQNINVPSGAVLGSERELQFYTVQTRENEDGSSYPDVIRVRYRILTEDTDPASATRVMRDEESLTREKTSEAAALTFHIPHARFFFAYQSGEKDAPMRWEKSWITGEKLPAALRVQWDMADGYRGGGLQTMSHVLEIPNGVWLAWTDDDEKK